MNNHKSNCAMKKGGGKDKHTNKEPGPRLVVKEGFPEEVTTKLGFEG